MHRVKVRHIETLPAFMKTGSVTEAADVLNSTQPNASKSVKQLEDAVGVSLFRRSGGCLQPTPEAGVLFAHAARLMGVLTLFETLSHDLARLKTGSVKIATLATFGVALLPLVIEAFNSLQPDVFVEIEIIDSDKIHSFVSRGHHDFGLAHHPGQEPDLLAETLRSGSMICILPIGHPLCRRATIMGADLAGMPLITYPRTL
jgi:DNA-binding transcriptional LysR family regulator